MGIKCPVCGNHGSYLSAVTTDGSPSKNGENIIGRKLSCGHIIGNTNYQKYATELLKISEEEYEAKESLKSLYENKKTAVWIKISENKEE